MKARAVVAAALLAGLSGPAYARQSTALPPVRDVNVRLAESADSFAGRVEAVVLSNGATAVVDAKKRRVALYDPTLSESITIFDSRTPAPLRLTAPPRLYRGAGDTVYMTDPAASGLRVISPDGQFVRGQRLFDAEDLVRIANLYSGVQFAAGGVMYFTMTLVPRVAGAFSAEPHDSVYLARYDFASRRRDTLGYVTLNAPSRAEADPSGTPTTVYVAPFEIGDAIAVNSAGRLAVIRGDDFHVDWLLPNGAWEHDPAVPWPWKRFTAAEKKAIVDARDSLYGTGRVQVLQPVGSLRPPPITRSDSAPDREPAFAPMSAIADQAGLIWLQLGARTRGELQRQPVYGALDTHGQLVDRIRLPMDRALLGFDKFGHVYASTRQGRIEVYRLK